MNKDRDRQFQQARREFSRANEQSKPVVYLLQLAEVAKRVGYKCVRSVKRAIDRGELPRPVPFGGQLCIVEAELEQCLRDKLENRDREVEQLRERRGQPLAYFRAKQQAPECP